MTPPTALETVKDYHDAWTSGDIAAAMSLVDEDVECRAPGVDLHGRAAYEEFIGGFAPMLTGIGDIAEFSEGDRVALFYCPQTATTSTTPAAELLTVEGGRIVRSVLIFDRLSYGPSEGE